MYSCRIEVFEDWMKSGFVMKKESYYQLDESMKLQEKIYYVFNWKKIILLVAIVIGIVILSHTVDVMCMPSVKSIDEGEYIATAELNDEIYQEEIAGGDVSLKNSEQSFAERCSTEYLAEEEFYEVVNENLGEELQYYINYIYARNGHVFQEGGTMDTLFQKESWYQEMSEKKIIKYEDLNRYEQRNIDLMVTILKREGYR